MQKTRQRMGTAIPTRLRRCHNHLHNSFAAPHHQYSIPGQTPQADFVRKCLLIPAAGHRAGCQGNPA